MKLHPQFFDYVRLLYPTVNFHEDVIVSIDGNGDATIEWNLPGLPPTDKEIEQANPPPFVPPKDDVTIIKDVLLKKNIISQTDIDQEKNAISITG